MYTAGELIEDYTQGNNYLREILNPEGDVICYVIVPAGNETYVEALLSHLNR